MTSLPIIKRIQIINSLEKKLALMKTIRFSPGQFISLLASHFLDLGILGIAIMNIKAEGEF